MGYNTAIFPMKKTHFFAALFFAASFIVVPLLFSSCGGGGSDKGEGSVKSSKTYPKNDVFGNVIALFLQYSDQDSIIEAKYEKAEDQLEEKYAGKPDKADKWTEEWEKLQVDEKADRTKNGEEFASAAEKEIADSQLIGKKVPFEQDTTGMGFEVTDFVISEVKVSPGFNGSGPGLDIVFKGDVKITDFSKFKKVFSWDHPFNFTPLDANGNPCSKTLPSTIHANEKDATEASFILRVDHIYRLREYNNFAKMKFENGKF